MDGEALNSILNLGGACKRRWDKKTWLIGLPTAGDWGLGAKKKTKRMQKSLGEPYKMADWSASLNCDFSLAFPLVTSIEMHFDLDFAF